MANLSSPVPVMKRSASGASSAKLDLKRYPPLKHNISFWGLLTPLPVPFIKAIVTLSLFQRSKYPISLLSSQSNLNDLFSFQIGNAVGAESIHQSPVGRNLSTSPRQFSFSPASPSPPPPPTPLFGFKMENKNKKNLLYSFLGESLVEHKFVFRSLSLPIFVFRFKLSSCPPPISLCALQRRSREIIRMIRKKKMIGGSFYVRIGPSPVFLTNVLFFLFTFVKGVSEIMYYYKATNVKNSYT